MMIGVVGLGYVGLVTAVVLASQGNKVVGIDTSDDKISSLNSGQLLFYEPGLKERFEEVSIPTTLLPCDASTTAVTSPT